MQGRPHGLYGSHVPARRQRNQRLLQLRRERQERAALVAATEPATGAPVEEMPLHGVLLTEGRWTGDGRVFEPGAARFDFSEGPLAFRWAEQDMGGHQGARHVGWIDAASRIGEGVGAEVTWEGRAFDPDFIEYLNRAGKAGVSIDGDDETYDVIMPEQALGDEEPQPGQRYPALQQRQVYKDLRVRAATAVGIPAFITGWVKPGQLETLHEPATPGGESVSEDGAMTASDTPVHAFAQPGGQFIPGGGRQAGKGKQQKQQRNGKPQQKHRQKGNNGAPPMTKSQKVRHLVKAILEALDDLLSQLSSAEAKALIENIKNNAEAFIEGAEKAHHGGGKGGGKKSGGGDSKKSSDSGKKAGGGKSGGGGNRLPAGAAGIIEGVERLLKHRGQNMKPGTRRALKRAVNQLESLTASAFADENFGGEGIDTEDIDTDLNVSDDEPESVTHAGILLKADDTGRWLLLQRALEEGDENGGLWEFPGGGLEDDEDSDPFRGAAREFAEEVGVPLPDSARVLGGIQSGDIYRLYLVAIPEEESLDIDGREVINPDDPDGDLTEAVAWWDPDHVTPGGYHIRPEVQNTDWAAVHAMLDGESASAQEEPVAEATELDLESTFATLRGNAEKLREYWTTGPGGLKIVWGTPGDFTRCVANVDKYMPGRAEGYCANLHKRMNGKWPNEAGAETDEFAGDMMPAVPTDDGTDAVPVNLENVAEEISMLLESDLPPEVADHLQKALEAVDAARPDDADEPMASDAEGLIASLKARRELSAALAVTSADTLTASAAPVAPPDEWFEPFDLDGPTGITITADGRVYGHLATWNSCHRNPAFQQKGVCVPPPKDPSPEFFHLGQVLTASGQLLPVGNLTVGGGHADTRLGLVAALEHYDDASSAVAVVRAHEDEFGIALFGSVVPEATPAQIAAARRAPLSGDWRKERGKFRLIAAHAVNTPGYPVPREQGTLVASVSPGAFVTTGRIEKCSTCGEDEHPLPESLVAAVVGDLSKAMDVAEREMFDSLVASFADDMERADADGEGPGENPDLPQPSDEEKPKSKEKATLSEALTKAVNALMEIADETQLQAVLNAVQNATLKPEGA